MYKSRLGWGGPCCVSDQRTSGLDFGSPSFITLATIMYYLAPNFVPFGQNFINPIEVFVHVCVCVCVCEWVGWLVCWCVCVEMGMIL